MKFKLESSKAYFLEEEKVKLEKLGLKFKILDNQLVSGENYYLSDEPCYIEINCLEVLMKIIKDYGTIVLGENEIELYNSYRE